MTKFTNEVIGKYKLPVMKLKISIGGQVKEFESPVAESILGQVRAITVGHDQVEYFDPETKTNKSFTYCCGDFYEFSYEPKEFEIYATELDCFGFPVTYDDSQKGEIESYKDAVQVKISYADYLKDRRAKQFGKAEAIPKASEGAGTKPVE